MRTDTLAIRDRLLAVLRAADSALTTHQACDLAGPYLETRSHRDWMHQPAKAWTAEWTPPMVSLVSCDGLVEVLAIHLACTNRGYQQLRALEQQGLARRIRVDGQRAVYWTAVGGQVADELGELEQMWSVQ